MVAGVGFEPTTSGPRVSAFFRDSPGKSQPGLVVLGGLKTEKAERLGPASKSQDWLRGLDLNQRPPGYEPQLDVALLGFSMSWLRVVVHCDAVFPAVLFPSCSQF